MFETITRLCSEGLHCKLYRTHPEHVYNTCVQNITDFAHQQNTFLYQNTCRIPVLCSACRRSRQNTICLMCSGCVVHRVSMKDCEHLLNLCRRCCELCSDKCNVVYHLTQFYLDYTSKMICHQKSAVVHIIVSVIFMKFFEQAFMQNTPVWQKNTSRTDKERLNWR